MNLTARFPVRAAVSTRLAALLALACCTAVSAADLPLSARLSAQDGWTAYRVPMVRGEGAPCCFGSRSEGMATNGCDLDSRIHSYGTSDGPGAPASTDTLAVYVHATGGRVDQVRAFADTCPVRSKSPVRWLEDIDSRDSIAFIAPWAQAETAGGRNHDFGLTALAYHADSAATTALGRLAGAGKDKHLREQSLFWLGHLRGAPGADLVERAATTDPDPKVRAHAVFALSQARHADGYARMRRIAGTDSSAHVRSQALFWMAQSGHDDADDDILAALGRDTSDDVREEAVFALSQLDDGRGDAALIALLQGDHPRRIKERAMFWLGQSGSPEAIAFFDRVLAGNGTRL